MSKRKPNNTGLSEMDINMIKGCIKNNEISKTQFFKKYYDRIYRTCLSYIKNSQNTDDLVQNIFIRLFDNLHTYTFSGNFEGYILRVSRNMAIDFLRRKKNIYTDTDMVESISNKIETLNFAEIQFEEDERQDKLALIHSEINKLSPQYKNVFMMYYVQSMKHKEISEELGISIGTSKSNLAKAKEKLRCNLN